MQRLSHLLRCGLTDQQGDDGDIAQGTLDEGQMHFNAVFPREGGGIFRDKGQAQQFGDGSAVHRQHAQRGGPMCGRMHRKPLHRHAMRWA